MNKRRDNVPFDPYYFEKRASNGTTFSLGDTFRHIYQTNHWRGTDSVSGEGATRNQVQQIEAELPTLLEALQVDVFLDLPCGDFSWMQFVNLPVSLYIGADIITELIAENQKRYGSQHRQFITLDLTVEPLPTAELLLCRDCLVHFSFADIHRTLDNIKRSDIAYLLTTTFPDCEENEDITTGDWRLLNLENRKSICKVFSSRASNKLFDCLLPCCIELLKINWVQDCEYYSAVRRKIQGAKMP